MTSRHLDGEISCGAGCRDNGIRIFRQRSDVDKDDSSVGVPAFELTAHIEQAHSQDVNCVAWHPKISGLLASAGDDEAVRLWQFAQS